MTRQMHRIRGFLTLDEPSTRAAPGFCQPPGRVMPRLNGCRSGASPDSLPAALACGVLLTGLLAAPAVSPALGDRGRRERSALGPVPGDRGVASLRRRGTDRLRGGRAVEGSAGRPPSRAGRDAGHDAGGPGRPRRAVRTMAGAHDRAPSSAVETMRLGWRDSNRENHRPREPQTTRTTDQGSHLP